MKTSTLILSLMFLSISVLTGPTRAQNSPADGEYIKEWLVLGPFFPDNLEKDFLAGVGGEANIHPQEGDIVTTADGISLAWKRYTSKESWIHLTAAIGYYENATAYALCILQSEVARTVTIGLGSNDGVVVWMNGQ